jgi:hypothetical protein
MLTGCREYRPLLVEFARGLAADSRLDGASPDERRTLMAHVEMCADCARVLEEQMALTADLRGLAGEALPEMAEIEARVLAEFDRMAARRRTALWVWAAGLAAAVLVGVVAVERRGPALAPPIRPQVRAAASAVPTVPAVRPASTRSIAPVTRVRRQAVRRAVSEETAPFVPIPYTVPLAPEERATIVLMEVPVAALIAAGYKVETADPGGSVDAEVLVSQDGRARAIRLNSKEEEQ